VADEKAGEDHASNPGTAPFVPEFDDTGEQSQPFVPTWDDTGEQSVPFVPTWDDTGSQPIAAVVGGDKEAATTEPEADQVSAAESGSESAAGAPVQSVTVPGRYQYLKWWKLVLVLFGGWAATAEVGLSLFYWWFHTVDKTLPVFVVLVYVVVCAVGGVMLAMVQGRPVIAALSIAVMSGPFGSLAAAAPLYGYYYCTRTGHCLVGVIPY
jgi:hypothetical protein